MKMEEKKVIKMNEDKIFTENPESELWRELLQYSYKANVERYFKDHSFAISDKVTDSIIGSFLQAYEYYKASTNTNLQISPLLLYYGTTNLLFGMSSLFAGEISVIHNHGMKPNASTIKDYIAETSVTFENPQHGGIHIYAKALGYNDDLTQYGNWSLMEFLASIAEISADYKKCYSQNCSNILMLDIFNTPNGKIEKIYFDSKDYSDILDVASNVEGIDKSYLRFQNGKDRDGTEYLILRHKMAGKDISKVSFSGQPYLQAGHIKNGKLITIPTILNMYIALFVMGSLCRYHPEIWSPFVLNDMTGEKLLIEKFLYYARRMIPNIVLNAIYNKRITYVTEKYTPKETIKLVGEHEVQELVKKEVYIQSHKNSILR
jgi:hypothetical protein